MSINVEQYLINMTESDRIAILLRAANGANEAIVVDHPETSEVCAEAIKKCRDWMSTKSIPPEALAAYLDSDDLLNPWMQESIFEGDANGTNALVFITMVVGHVAYLAYRDAGKARQMSETIAEAGENILGQIVAYGNKLALFDFL